MVIGRIKASSLVKVGSGLVPSDLKGSDFPSLESCFGGSFDGHVRTVFDLSEQRVGLRKIADPHRRASPRKPVVADNFTEVS